VETDRGKPRRDNRSPFRGPTEVETLLRDVMQALVRVQVLLLARIVTKIPAVDLAVVSV
jgi:hypothetical protein